MFRQITFIVVVRLGYFVINFLISVLVSRFYGPEGKGTFTLLFLIPNLIVQLFNMSIGEGYLYYFSKGYTKREFLISTSLLFFVLFSILALISYLVIYLSSSYPTYFIPQLLLLTLMFFNEILVCLSRALKLFKEFGIIFFKGAVVNLSFLIFLIYVKLDVKFLLWGYVLSFFYMNFALFRLVNLNLKNSKNKVGNFSIGVYFKKVILFSIKVHLFKVLNILENKFDILFLAQVLSTAFVGIYSISVSLVSLFQNIIAISINTVLLPTLVSYKGKYRKFRTARNFLVILFFLSVIYFCFVFVFGEQLIVLLFGNSFRQAYFPLIILSIGLLMKSSVSPINSFFKAIGKPDELYKTSVFSLTANIILCVFLIPRFGIIGAALASTISYFLYGSIMLVKFFRERE